VPTTAFDYKSREERVANPLCQIAELERRTAVSPNPTREHLGFVLSGFLQGLFSHSLPLAHDGERRRVLRRHQSLKYSIR
jgi:hypothetical protein